VNVLRAEFRKLFTTQTWFWLLIGSLALNALNVVGTLAGSYGSQGYYARHAVDVFGAGSSAFLFVLILGVIGITAEFRHQTITPTVLTTPSRGLVIGAKLVAYLILGVGYAIAGLIVVFAIAVPWLSAKGISLDLGSYGIPRAIFGSLVVVALYAVFGVGFGALITNQAAAVTLSIVISTVVTLLLIAIPGVRNVYPYTPSGAAQAVTLSAVDRHQDHFTFLAPAAGAVVLLAWGLVLAACGVYRMSRDIS
jgi:hypothetical protein